MTDSRISTTACLAIIALIGCTNGSSADPSLARPAPLAAGAERESQAVPANQQSIINAAREDAASRLAVSADAIGVVSAQRVTWPDGSLGCPEPDMHYTQALVPGWRIFLRANGRTLDYHAAANGHFYLCPPERATEPIPGDPI